MAEAKSLYTASTGLCADSIEAVPGVRGLFALATYQVDKEEAVASISAKETNLEHNEEILQVDDAHDEGEGAGESPAYTRRGTCTLHRVRSPATIEMCQNVDCESVQTVQTPAILDMKWSVTSSSDKTRRILGIANARGEIELRQLSRSFDRLEHLSTLTMNNSRGKTLALSLDWSDRRGGFLHGHDFAGSTQNKDTSLIVSQSDGSLCYLPSLEAALYNTNAETVAVLSQQLASTNISKYDGGNRDSQEDWDQTSEDEREEESIAAHAALNQFFEGRPRGLETWNAHEYEAWIAAFDCWSSSVVWSGGDDLTLRGWDLRTALTSSGRSSSFSTTKCFDGGVTTLQSSHMRQHLWAVGSYDSKLRLFDARQSIRPLVETDLGGGIWRVKWHPTDPSKLLVGCMHDGFKVVTLNQLASTDGTDAASIRGSDFEIVTRFDQHSSLAYGCDWDRHVEDSSETEDRLVYSCSFYDASMHIWRS